MIRFQRPSLPPTEEIDRYLELAREERWFSNDGPCCRLLRERLGERAGAYCVPVASGTLGLMAALAAVLEPLRAGSCSAIAMPAFTFAASAQAALWAGLEPRLLDISADHWHLDEQLLERAIADGEPAEAVLAVSAFGTPPPAATRSRWEAVCREAGLPLIVDSAAGFGAVAEDGVPIGRQGDVEVVSFHATKPFAIGEGGAVFTRDRELYERIARIVNFGFRPDHSVGSAFGLNAKMSELHAATALAVLDGIDEVLERRRVSAAAIRSQAGDALAWQEGSERSTWQFVPVAAPGPEERRAIAARADGRVETRVYYEPLDRLMPGQTTAPGDLIRTAELHERIICLPMANDLTEAEVGSIATTIAA